MFTPCFNIKKNREVTLIALCCLQRNHSLWCEGKGDLIRQDRFGLGGMDGLMEIQIRYVEKMERKALIRYSNNDNSYTNKKMLKKETQKKQQ